MLRETRTALQSTLTRLQHTAGGDAVTARPFGDEAVEGRPHDGDPGQQQQRQMHQEQQHQARARGHEEQQHAMELSHMRVQPSARKAELEYVHARGDNQVCDSEQSRDTRTCR